MALNILPNAGQLLGQTRAQIRDNFVFIDTGFAVNHVDFNSGANSGKHRFISMPAAAPASVTIANEVALFSQVVNGSPQLMFQAQNNATPYAITDGTSAAVGWTRAPNGLLVFWARQTGLINGSNPNILFSSAANFPGFTAPAFHAQVSLFDSVATDATTTVRLVGLSNSSVTIYAQNVRASSIGYVLVLGV